MSICKIHYDFDAWKIWSGALSYKSAPENKAELEVGVSLGQKLFDHPKCWSFVGHGQGRFIIFECFDF